MEYSEFKAEVSNLYSAAESRILWQAFLESKETISAEFFISQLLTGKPYQQILGSAEFFGQNFFVNEHVLIPRPETEELLELAIDRITKAFGTIQNLEILDIGTGSGVISIILKKYFPQANITAIDVDQKALEVAKSNADSHEVEVNFLLQDYLVWKPLLSSDVIFSNPPYIGQDEETDIAFGVKSFEPHHALFSPTDDPLIFYRKIAEDARKMLKPGGMVFLEINQQLGNETLNLFASDFQSALLKDLSGNDRFVIAEKLPL